MTHMHNFNQPYYMLIKHHKQQTTHDLTFSEQQGVIPLVYIVFEYRQTWKHNMGIYLGYGCGGWFYSMQTWLNVGFSCSGRTF